MSQYQYIKKIAEENYYKFLEQGYATPGNNGPHGHLDTPVRNTAHYLIIYSFLYKENYDERYLKIANVFKNYLIDQQKNTASGAVQCMYESSFDRINGLIGQAWVIESLVYYYETFGDVETLITAKKIFMSQEYDYNKHIWKRVDIDGSILGYDFTLNHQVCFAACSSKLSKLLDDNRINDIIEDFVSYGLPRYFKIHSNGLIKHDIFIFNRQAMKIVIKRVIKFLLSPFKSINPRKFDYRYIEYGYHIFDLYVLSILRGNFDSSALFQSKKYDKAINLVINLDKYNKYNCVYNYNNLSSMNVYGYPYNSPAFEYPYVVFKNGIKTEDTEDIVYELQSKLMMDSETNMFTKNNPDINTWNARTYEYIRYLDENRKNDIHVVGK